MGLTTIREAAPADVPAIAAGMRVVAAEGWLATQSSTTEEELRERFVGAVETDVIVVGERGGRIIGCVGLHPTAVEGVWSLGIWVLADARGSGLGGDLLDAALAAARVREIRKIDLEVFAGNEPAIALYRSRGFDVEGTRREHYPRADGTIRSAVIMALFPSPQA